MSGDRGLDDTVRSDGPGAGSDVAGASTLDLGDRPTPTLEPGLRARVASALFGRAPATIGRFQMLGDLGKGGMSVVYRARDPDLDREVAIKLLQGGAALGTHGRARLQREAMAMAKLSHPNVAHVYEVGVHEGAVFVAMEYVVGETLRAFTESHRDDPAAIVAMFRAAGEGLAAAHEAGFVHRDFKPENVIVGVDGRPRVLDFGLAAVLGDRAAPTAEIPSAARTDLLASLTATGSILGTPAYMAPEQHRGGATDARTDQFAFCVALWEALAGARPFRGDTLGAIAQAVSAGEIIGPAASLPVRIERVLRRGLAVEPDDRYPSMRTLLAALDASARRRSLPFFIASGVVAAAVGFAVIQAARSPDPPTAPDSRDAPELVVPPSVAAGETPAPPTGPLSLQQLTHTSGHGVEQYSAAIDERGGRLVYRAEGQRWVVELAGGVPRPLDLGGDYDEVSFDPLEDGFLARNAAGMWRVRPGGAAEHLAYEVPDDAGLVTPSPKGDQVIFFRPGGTVLQTIGAPARTVLEDRNVLFTSWAPDGERWAVIATDAAWSSWHAIVLDGEGSTLHEVDLGEHSEHFEGFSLTREGNLVFATASLTDSAIRCVALEESGVRLLAERPLDLPRTTVATVIRGTPSGGTLLQMNRFPRDVGILDAVHPGPMAPLSRDLDASNTMPYWIDDSTLGFVTDRFGGGTWMVHDLRTGQSVPDDRFTGDVVSCSAFEGRPVCAAGDPVGLFRTDGASSVVRVADAPKGIATLECADDPRCRAIVVDDTNISILGLDPATGGTEGSFLCNPTGLACSPERFALAPDGRTMIASQGDRKIVRIDANTGEIVDTDLVQPLPGYIAQSAAESRDGTVLSTQMAVDDPSYRVVRTKAGKSEVLWDDPDTWTIRPRVSPDGRHVVVTTVLFHTEVALLPEDPCG